MPELYPAFLDLRGRLCLVVGGGRVAERKVEGLLAAGATVRVVAPDLCEGLRRSVEAGEVEAAPRGYESADLDGTALAFVATSDPEVNRRAVAEARARGVWVNAAETPAAGDLQVPAVVRRGPVTVAVSSSGAAPALAAWVRDRVARDLPDGLEALAQVLSALRQIAPPGRRLSGDAQRALFESGLLDDLGRGDWETAEEKIGRFFDGAPRLREILGRSATEAT